MVKLYGVQEQTTKFAIDKNGNIIQKLDDGSTKITTPDGRSFLVDKNGNANINLPTIQKVSIDRLIRIVGSLGKKVELKYKNAA